MDKHFRISAIIARSFRGELSHEDQRHLDEWLDSSPSARELYDELKNHKREAEAMRLFDQFDQSSAFGRLSAITSSGRTKKPVLRYWLPAAAAVIIFISIGILLLNDNSGLGPSTVVATAISVPPGKPGAVLTLSTGERFYLDAISRDSILFSDKSGSGIFASEGQLSYLIEPDRSVQVTDESEPTEPIIYSTLEVPLKAEFKVLLSDGTAVYLNAQSKLRYPSKFGSGNREVEVEGEAFFEVAHDGTRPFIVSDSDGNKVEVKGTSFNVRNYEASKIEVALAEGNILFVSCKGTAIAVNPGEAVIYDRSTDLLRTERVDIDEETAWKNGRFIFNNRSLENIFSSVSRWYGVNAVFEDEEVKNMRFTADIRKYSDLGTLINIFESTESVIFELDGGILKVNNAKNRKKLEPSSGNTSQ